MIIRITVVFFLLSLSGVAATDTVNQRSPASVNEFLQMHSYFPVSFQSDEEEHFLLTASVGKSKIRLIVDTGCIFTTINRRSVPDAKTLGELKTELRDSLLGEISDPTVMLLPELSFGPARFLNQPARGEALSADYVKLRFDGILGVDFLARNFCVIDCATRKLYFRGAAPTPDQAKAIYTSLKVSGYTPIPIQPRKWLIVSGTACGQKTDWVLDTGANYTLIEESELARLKVKRETKTDTGSYLPRDIAGRVIGLQRIGLGTHRLTVTRLSNITFGDRAWTNAYVGVLDIKMSDIGERPISSTVHGFLGNDILRAHRALIDFSSWQLWFSPESKAPKS